MPGTNPLHHIIVVVQEILNPGPPILGQFNATEMVWRAIATLHTNLQTEAVSARLSAGELAVACLDGACENLCPSSHGWKRSTLN